MWGPRQPTDEEEEQEQLLWQEIDQYMLGIGEPRPLVDILDNLIAQADILQQALDLAVIAL